MCFRAPTRRQLTFPLPQLSSTGGVYGHCAATEHYKERRRRSCAVGFAGSNRSLGMASRYRLDIQGSHGYKIFARNYVNMINPLTGQRPIAGVQARSTSRTRMGSPVLTAGRLPCSGAFTQAGCSPPITCGVTRSMMARPAAAKPSIPRSPSAAAAAITRTAVRTCGIRSTPTRFLSFRSDAIVNT